MIARLAWFAATLPVLVVAVWAIVWTAPTGTGPDRAFARASRAPLGRSWIADDPHPELSRLDLLDATANTGTWQVKE